MPKPSRWPRCVTRFGVVPICRALAVHGVQIAPRTYADFADPEYRTH
jgi:hypothetical protein